MSAVPVILNPVAGGGRLLRGRARLLAAAAAAGAELEFWNTRGPGHATELAARVAAEGRPLVFAYGGDGTYNEVARGLLGSATAMGVLPGGTTSVLAYEFAVPRPAGRAAAALLQGRDLPMRVGCSDRGDLVLLMLSAGPDSHVLERLWPSLKRLGGKVGLALQAVLELARPDPLPRMRMALDGSISEVGWVIVGKSRCYGGPLRATPGADPFRGDLEVVAQRSCGRRAAVAFLAAIPVGRHVRRRDVIRSVVDRVRLEAAPGAAAAPYQVDGDIVGTLPVEVGIDSRPLVVRLPRQGAEERSPASRDPGQRR